MTASFTANVQRLVLPNGLTVLVQPDPSASVVAVVTHVKAGYFDEPDEWVGIAHVLEHMFFKGTRRRGPGDLARETQLLGGYLNASTIYDKTVYYTVLPSGPGALRHALDIQGDALMNSVLDQGELSRELEVVIQEAKRKLDNPPAVATETLFQILFRVHRMRRWRIGTEEGLRKLDAAALRAYYESRYAPSRTIVCLAGALEAGEALALATETYGGWRRAPGAFSGSPAEPDDMRPAHKILHGDIERPLAVIGWRTIPELHPDAPALDIAAAILGSGRGSWLSRQVRTPGIAASVSASHYTPTEVGVFDITLQGDETRLDEAIDRTLALTGELARSGPDEAELGRVRSLLALRWSRALETMDGRASTLAEFEALGGYHLADEVFQELMAVSADDVRRVAGKYLGRERSCAVLYLSRSGSSRLGAEIGAWPPRNGGPAPEVGSPAVPVLAPRRARQRAGTERTGEVHHVAVEGCDLLCQAKRGSGLVSVGLFVPGLRESENSENAGISWLLARGALRGAAHLDTDMLAAAAEAMGGVISPSAGLDTTGWSMTVPARHLAGAMRLLRAVAEESTLAIPDLEIERGLQLADAVRVRDDMYRYPLQRVLGLAFPGDPYGLPALGTPESIGSLNLDAVKSWKDALLGRRAIAVAVGDLETDQLLDGLAQADGWAGRVVHQPGEAPVFRAEHAFEPRQKKQSALAMAFEGVTAGDSRRYAVDVLADFLSGLAGRLFQVLREERALAYTVTAAPWMQRRAGAFFTYIATSPEREAEARDAMLESLRAVAAGDVSEAEVERARRYAAGLVQIGRQTAGAVTGEIVGAWVHGLLADIPLLPSRLLAVTAADVVREAAALFGNSRRAEYVVRGAGAEGR